MKTEKLTPYLPLVAAAAIIGVAAYFFWKNLKGTGTNAADAAGTASGTPTLSPVQLSSLADQIEAAGIATLGTDENAIFAAFDKLQNQADLNGLILAFGERRAEFTLATVTLPAFLSTELSDFDLEIIRADLAKKGIKL